MTPFATRFWSKVDRSGGPEACWLWTGATRAGYGRITIGYRCLSAHRVVWELRYGLIPAGLDALHRCVDVRCCVNYRHLYLGTDIENTRDRRLQGRIKSGSQLPHAKLTEATVREIRRCYALDSRWGVLTRLGRQFGIASTTVASIVEGKTWKHVETYQTVTQVFIVPVAHDDPAADSLTDPQRGVRCSTEGSGVPVASGLRHLEVQRALPATNSATPKTPTHTPSHPRHPIGEAAALDPSSALADSASSEEELVEEEQAADLPCVLSAWKAVKRSLPLYRGIL